MKYLKINHDEAKPAFEWIDFPEDPLAWLHTCCITLGCRYIETASTLFPRIVLVIDEEGKLTDDWYSRINKVATTLYGSYSDPIVGDAILFRVQGEDFVPLSPYDIDRLSRLFPNSGIN